MWYPWVTFIPQGCLGYNAMNSGGSGKSSKSVSPMSTLDMVSHVLFRGSSMINTGLQWYFTDLKHEGKG